MTAEEFHCHLLDTLTNPATSVEVATRIVEVLADVSENHPCAERAHTALSTMVGGLISDLGEGVIALLVLSHLETLPVRRDNSLQLDAEKQAWKQQARNSLRAILNQMPEKEEFAAQIHLDLTP